MPKRSAFAAATAVTALVAAALVGPPSAGATVSASKVVPNTKPTWVGKAHDLGQVTDATQVSARVYLAPRGGLAALAAAGTAVSTPGNAAYGHYLTAAQYNAKYAPTASAVAKVTNWLRNSGFRVGAVGANNRYVTIAGTAKSAKKAFSATIHAYNHSGRTVHAPTGALSVPTGLASSVLTITGVDTTPHTVAPTSQGKSVVPDAAPSAAFANARPCSLYYGQISGKYKADFTTPLPKFKGPALPYTVCGYTGPQLRAAYEGGTTLDGTGVTVAVVDAYASPTIAADITTYAESHGDGSYAPGQYSEIKDKPFTLGGPDDCDASGWYGEQTLDIEAVHAMAPGANIRYYGASNCDDDGFIPALAQVVDEDTAQLVTNSWGDTEANTDQANIPAYEAIFLQGALEGIGFMFSSGDDGDDLEASGITQTEYPTDDPYVTSVGGTSVAIGANGRMEWRSDWGTGKYSLLKNGKGWKFVDFWGGAGGGVSGIFDQPAYQVGTTSGPARQVPDVAMDADPTTGMLVGQTQTYPDGSVRYGEYRIGGTSLASPLFAGMTALKLQHEGHGLGMLNPLIYKNQSQFIDVTNSPGDIANVRVDYVNSVDGSDGLAYSIRTFGQDTTLKATAGWDNDTGVGEPSTTWFRKVAVH